MKTLSISETAQEGQEDSVILVDTWIYISYMLIVNVFF